MDEQLILTALTLRLNPRVKRASPIAKVVVLKKGNRGSHLIVSDKHWEVLRHFLNPITVPEVIRVLILNRSCLPLREYYELVLKAYREGILLSEPEEETGPEEEGRWLAFPGGVFVLPAIAALGVVLLWLALNPLPVLFDWSIDWPSIAVGAGCTSIALTLGDILAAMALTKAGVPPPPLGLVWRTLCPHLGVRLRDSAMLKPVHQVGVHAARILPLASVTLGLVAFRPLLGLFSVLTLLLILRPFGGGTMVALLSCFFRGYSLDTHKRLIFSMNQGVLVRCRFAWERINARYAAARLLYAALWGALLLYLASKVLGYETIALYHNKQYWLQVAWYGGWVVGAAFLIVAGPPLARAVARRILKAGMAIVLFAKRWLSDTAEYSSHPAILHTMGQSAVFRRLGQIGRLGLIVAGQVQRFGPWKTLDSQNGNLQPGLILSGRVAVFRESLNGKWQRVAYYQEGDLIGSEAWADPDGGPVRCKTLTPVIVISWTPEVFGRQIFSVLGPALAMDLMVKVPFLRSLRICREWHPQALIRFAQIARLSQFSPDTKVITEGEAVLWFFVIFSGRVITRKKRLRRATLHAGDYFGELSLLRQDVATADVITLGPARCVLIHRPEFMRFMTHNPSVALELEKVSSFRLGRPVFPYKP